MNEKSIYVNVNENEQRIKYTIRFNYERILNFNM